MKVGIGFDVHPFVKARPLYLGGVKIKCDRGLKGHSDGDALIHSIIDAVLGASGKGDKGKYFPDTDPEYKDISSSELLNQALKIAKAQIINIDCIVFCEKPKISVYYEKMKKNIAGILKIDKNLVSIKATRPEGLSLKEDGIACFCACLIEN
ncbi:MAG: 2-C-methyl-D-erythritol 2,4-cyclodiphosphate synthase [Elusimicrobia bacterium CG08_land_8_20_14_0_20_44_26]|nr:MAG: 2-C-methyl-D-erythritol 2,4-cyclodiphosphate synthase [Elusimicrobia bacterium CG08_land_8_20_14_0_20_44_26]